jgi:hypothetical protein
MENKEIRYYTPKLEELFIGYKSTLSINSNIISDDIIIDVHSIKDYKEKMIPLLTKHLDKSDIESLGWEYNEKEKTYSKHFSGYCESFTYTLKHIEHQKAIKIKLTYVSPEESFKNKTYYCGKCPSINELKYIMKLLEIQ